MELEELLSELAAKGVEHDLETSERSRKQLNITKDTGEFLTVLIRASCAESILEIGTSNGYSTLWLAAATSGRGVVTTLEVQQHKIDQAKVNFDRSGLASKIDLVKLDAADYLNKINRQYDFIFLDAERSEYMNFSAEVIASLRVGGLLVCDNALSHQEELADFIGYIKNSRQFSTSLVNVGKGEFVACKIA